jgi:hypothetical protein
MAGWEAKGGEFLCSMAVVTGDLCRGGLQMCGARPLGRVYL